MSANMIARWNAISLSRPEPNSKRSRPEDEAGEEDQDEEVSTISRTPSPQRTNVDGGLSKYDEYVHGTSREVITVETKIKPTNKGFAMLSKLGWSEGQPLGISRDGRVDPIPFRIKQDLTGLGKTSQDVRMIETTVSQRRGLDSERQRKETEDQRRAREVSVARKSALESEISTTLKAFYCALCDKQFKTVSQYDEHTNSYAHHHKARFKDMQANIRLKPKEEVDKRKEKERKREERELRKIAAANGIKMAKPSPTNTSLSDVASSSNGMEIDTDLPPPVKRAGWAVVSSTSELPGGQVAGSSVSATPVGQDASQIDPSKSVDPGNQTSAPSFRTAGWTSLDTGSSHSLPPQNPESMHAPPAPLSLREPGSYSHSGLNDSLSSTGGVIPFSSQPLSQLPISIPPAASPVRSGWQQFQKSSARKR